MPAMPVPILGQMPPKDMANSWPGSTASIAHLFNLFIIAVDIHGSISIQEIGRHFWTFVDIEVSSM